MDKISIVSSQAVLEMSFTIDTRSMFSSPLVNSLAKNWLFKTAPDIDEPPFQFIHTMDLSVVDTMLQDSPDLVIHRSVLFGGHSLDARKFGVSWRSSSTVARARHSVLVHCPAGTKSLPDTLLIAGSSMTSLWVTSWSSIEKVSKGYHHNFLLCNNKIIAYCKFIQQFCEVYAVAF